MFNIILYQPRIPQNTGNIGRLCAYTNCSLHLIHPLGFLITDKYLKRSGMDYWLSLDLHHYSSWNIFLKSLKRPKRIWLFTTNSKKKYWHSSFKKGDGLLFGNETSGVSKEVESKIGEKYSLTLPCFAKNKLRSLNLATSVGIALYESIRQIQC